MVSNYIHTTCRFLEELAANICELIPDYHRGKTKFDIDHVITWVSQFERNDRKFILEEFLHVLNQKIYIPEARARKILIKAVEKQAEHFGYDEVTDYLKHVDFLRMQEKYKSQNTLLDILDEELQKKYDISMDDCGSKSNKYAVYVDDILATGGTIHDDCKEWLQLKNADGETNLTKVVNNKKIFLASLFCLHKWGEHNVRWRLKFDFDSDLLRTKIKFQANYIVENHPTEPNQKFNHAYPVKKEQPEHVLKYLESLKADRKGEFAFRDENKPKNETFFSSSANRNRFENILLNKGIDLLGKRMHLENNHRPLGMTNPTKKILGTGTLFLTWRNISNTSPIVFWWKVGKDWYPLFELDNRGIF